MLTTKERSLFIMFFIKLKIIWYVLGEKITGAWVIVLSFTEMHLFCPKIESPPQEELGTYVLISLRALQTPRFL